MTARDQTPPAFPSEQGFTPENTWNQSYSPGMTYRQWLSGQVAAGLLANPAFLGPYQAGRGGFPPWHLIAADIVQAVDAIILQGNK